jgi:small multidrug resistance pump
MIPFYLSLILAILIGVLAQTLLKLGASSDTPLSQLLARQSILGLLLYGLAALCYMFALRKIPVSVAFPSVSLSYVLVAGVGYWFFDESLAWPKLAGIGLIFVGVLIVARQG